MYQRILRGSLVAVILGCLLGCQPQPQTTLISPQSSSLLISDELATAPEVDSLIAPYKVELEDSMNQVVGYAARELTEQNVESTLGNFIADLILETGRELWGDSVSLSLVTIGALRVPLPEGPVTLSTLYELMPFENRMVLLKLSGHEVQQLFDYGARYRNIAVSNSRAEIQGSKAVRIEVGGQPLKSDSTYYLSTYDYLAWGGDEMEFMREIKILDHSDVLFRDAIVLKMQRLHQQELAADAKIEGRIIILN